MVHVKLIETVYQEASIVHDLKIILTYSAIRYIDLQQPGDMKFSCAVALAQTLPDMDLQQCCSETNFNRTAGKRKASAKDTKNGDLKACGAY